jgi:hypothetical protein
VLAAGAGRRFHGPDHKLLAPWRGRPVVGWALEHAAAASLDRTWVVTGAVDLVAAGVVPPGVEVLFNDKWQQGQATSLNLAISAAELAGLDAVVWASAINRRSRPRRGGPSPGPGRGPSQLPRTAGGGATRCGWAARCGTFSPRRAMKAPAFSFAGEQTW